MDWITNKTLKRHWFSHWGRLSVILLIGWIGAVSTFFLSLMTGWFFDLMYQNSISKSELLADFGLRVGSLQQFFGILGLVILLKFFLHFWERQLIRTKAEKFNFDLMQRLFRRQLQWTSDYYNKNGFGKYLLRYSGDQLSVRNMLCNGFHRGLRDAFFLLTGLGLLVYLNPYWTLTIVATLLIVSPVAFFLDSKQIPWTISKRNKKSLVLKYVTETFSNQKGDFTKSDRIKISTAFQEKSQQSLRVNLQYQFWENSRLAWVAILGPLLTFSLLAAISFAPDTKESPGQLLAFMLVIGAMAPAIRSISKTPSIIAKGMISLRKIEVLIKKKTPLTYSEKSKTDKEAKQGSESTKTESLETDQKLVFLEFGPQVQN
ncbi:ABC transporter transmembrane domain-containing protein [Algoriphagus formosus]|uniref:ABC transporter transmembrane domain-containing protein n=1 Tax=Algoriphagus formosus TaxID=2007308 RepID=UPI000C290194|nr:ABC transporter transmembrane domain-containing protein [Algoriphagus formosus]